MAREIKFRAWDGELRKMCHMVYVGAEGWNGEYWENGAMVSCFSDENHKDNALMQFTGLHDKNGVEIFEGDIVCIRYSGKQEIFKQEEVKWGVFNIGVNGHEYDFDVVGPYVEDEYLYMKMINGEVEVIGNRYENPELLKGDGHENPNR